MSTCQRGDCAKPARAAVTTRRPQRDNVTSQIWYDDRSEKVPAKAERLCKEHAVDTITSLANTLIDEDD